MEFSNIARPLNVFVPFLMPVNKKKFIRPNLRRGRKHKIAKSEETAFVTPIFSALNDRQEKFHKLWKFEKFHR